MEDGERRIEQACLPSFPVAPAKHQRRRSGFSFSGFFFPPQIHTIFSRGDVMKFENIRARRFRPSPPALPPPRPLRHGSRGAAPALARATPRRSRHSWRCAGRCVAHPDRGGCGPSESGAAFLGGAPLQTG